MNYPTGASASRTSAEFPNAMTVDVEDYFQVSAFADAVPRSSWDSCESRVVENTRRIIRLFEQEKIGATFFVLGWVAERFPNLVKEISAAGFEVGCHGYSHELIYRQTPDEFRDETIRAKSILEQILGTQVVGYRAASYSITEKSSWALDIICEAGFQYDSSIFPGRHDRYGMPGALRYPHILKTPNGSRIAEFPISIAKWAGINVPVAGGGYFRLIPYAITKWGLHQLNEQESMPFVFYLHPWELDVAQPRIEASLLSKFRHYTNIAKCESRLRDLIGRFRFVSMQDSLKNQGLLMLISDTGRNHAPDAAAQFACA